MPPKKKKGGEEKDDGPTEPEVPAGPTPEELADRASTEQLTVKVQRIVAYFTSEEAGVKSIPVDEVHFSTCHAGGPTIADWIR